MPEQPPYLRLKPYLHSFPEAKDVFASAEQNGGVSPERAAYFAPPLLSIDLAAVNPDWVGRIHIVTVLEDANITDGYFADGMEEFHSYYTRSNWIGFQLDKHSRYRLLGDWRCFYAMSDDEAVRNRAEVLEAYQKHHKNLTASRAFYRQHQDLPFSYDEEGQTYEGYVKGQGFLQQWSAGRIRPDSCNWEDSGGFPLVELTEPPDEDENWPYPWLCPITEDGRPFIYIGSVCGYQYHEGGPGRIVLFYDPITRIALQTFDWS